MSDVIFVPTDLALDYTWNEIVERTIADMLSTYTSIAYYDMANYARPEYDWLMSGVRIELKTTLQNRLFVELSKDPEGLTPSGLGGSEAEIVIVLMRGYNKLPEGRTHAVGKLRAYSRRKLIAHAKRRGIPYQYVDGALTEHAYGYQLWDVYGIANETWLADVPIVSLDDGREGYNLSKSTVNRYGMMGLACMIQAFSDGDM